uniref:Uncharacterized protein n=1 Tax=Candidatus Methanogaster sp. ANME-2c ERB4 TaxID=2759911 RepID=A0A7G9YQR5_9EURY|nr:hypothetical protein DELCLCLG_00003 [Methanosarcinales archaeon ANME-2c ERB4]
MPNFFELPSDLERILILLRILFLTFICIVLLVRGTKARTIERTSLFFTPHTFIGYHYDFIQNFVHSVSIISAFYCLLRK